MLTHSALNAHNAARRARGPAPARDSPPVPRPHTNTLSTANTEPDLLPEADATEGLRPVPLQAIELDAGADIDGAEPCPVKIEHFRPLGSYNWIDAPQPTILVPGSPPEWRERALPFRVPYDTGLQIFDPNGYYMGVGSTLVPLLRAVDAVAEDAADTSMDWPAVDFVLDRSSLRKLLRWIRAADKSWNTNWNANSKANTEPSETVNIQASGRPDALGGSPKTKDVLDFRLDLQLGGKKTVLVERWDTRTCMDVNAPKYGCRSNFDDAATRPGKGCESSKYHNRIVQYDLEGLKLVVRFEADAYNPSPDDGLSDLLADLTLSSSLSPPLPTPPLPPHPTISNPHSDTTLTVLRGGVPVPHSSLVEIATRSPKGLAAHKWHETYTQLFLTQTPNFYAAVHQNALFTSVAKHTLAGPPLARYAHDARMQRSLRQMVRVLGAVQKLVVAHGERGRLSLLCRNGRLELFEREGDAGRLPESELARFKLGIQS